MTDPTLFDEHVEGLPPVIRFDGESYDPDRDAARLGTQAKAVFEVMREGSWHSLASLSRLTGFPEASISARLRDLRKAKFGSNTVERQNTGGGRWVYRLTPAREEWK